MHAANFLVYWSRAVEVCRGLIMMMTGDDMGLQAVAGKMVGYTALHLICQNSDRRFKKAELAELMLRRRAKVDPRTVHGHTPFLFAVGTGLVDVAKVLVGYGCDVYAETSMSQGKPRRNAADMCMNVARDATSSGSMKEYPWVKKPYTGRGEDGRGEAWVSQG